MRTYTVHLPADLARGDPRALDKAVVVPDGFSWGAFAFSVLWFLRHRLWLAGLLVAVLLAGVIVGGRLIGLSLSAQILVIFLCSILLGFEASSLRRWTYGRSGRPARDAVIANSRDEAEAKAFARWVDPSVLGTARPAAVVRHGGEAVVGLFPSTEGSR